MESGLEDRNNRAARRRGIKLHSRLNGVRPRRPEQFRVENPPTVTITVSMESGLEDRNNQTKTQIAATLAASQWSPA